MNEELDYAEMLEIPVSQVNVVKKKGFFKRKQEEKKDTQEDLKERVVESVNERVGAYVYSEDLSDPPKPVKQKMTTVGKKDRGSKVLWGEAIALGVIAIAIFLTNLFVPNTVINTFLSTFSKTEEVKEPVYNEFTLSSVVSDFSDAEVAVTSGGVLYFTAEGSVYPVCEGKVSKVYEDGGMYTVEIAHTSAFVSVMTGLDHVYSEVGAAVEANIPVGYSKGENEVHVTLYNNGELLNCFTMTGAVPVWVS